MNNYNDFGIEDWLNDAKFQNWVFRRDSDLLWKKYIESNPAQYENMEQARKILLSIKGDLDIVTPQEVKVRVSEIVESLDDSGSSNSVNFWWKPGWLRVAATILLVAGLGGIFWKNVFQNSGPYYTLTKSHASESLDELINDTDQSQLVNLPDGSSVILQSNSRISFPHKFNPEKREVYLLGEAFFEVHKNPHQPFYVYANELITKVLGTSFNVRAYEDDKEVSVVVKTGKVSVFAQNSREAIRDSRSLNGMILTPNQQATLGRRNLQIVRKVVDQPEILNLPADNQNFSFKRKSVASVFELLEKAYGVDIVFDEDLTANCTITAELGNEPLFEKLNMICAVMEANFESIDGQIIINTKGCK
ncbi:FecR family protein [Dyadobacter psychrotolerans]|uniref:FecR family protein n=1 Tax=Dyadobacter psychrotolerans TaxID=2541721 RepID=A0A4R5DDH7_9BACT|nr:FecR family protein [Dyadobacter psychrotolerans]TDE11097.1 FecR family protein [Dyadobacter psychrotolerans]